jgi:hypothetical protein
LELLARQESEIGLARHEPAHASDDVFDAAFLPGSIGVAEEGFDRVRVQIVMTGELGALRSNLPKVMR